MVRSARMADKICDDPEAARRLRILERLERLREEHGLPVVATRPRQTRQRQRDMCHAEAVRGLRASVPAWGNA